MAYGLFEVVRPADYDRALGTRRETTNLHSEGGGSTVGPGSRREHREEDGAAGKRENCRERALNERHGTNISVHSVLWELLP